MECYIIPPNNNLELMHLGDRYFCLAQHYYSNETYRNFFKERVAEGKWVTLDNGAGDFALITEDILFECMKDLMPSEVIPPDVLFNKEQTLLNLDSFIKRMQDEDLLGKVEIFACPQGLTKEAWLECYKEMLFHPFVNTLGLSKIAVPMAFLGLKDDKGIAESRNMCYDYLVENDLLKKPIHCLGQGDPREFIHYTSPYMRSTDSCYTILAAMNGINFKEGNFERIPTPHTYFDSIVTSEQVQIAAGNVEVLKKQFCN